MDTFVYFNIQMQLRSWQQNFPTKCILQNIKFF